MNSIGMDMLLGVHHHKALAFRAHVTRVSNMESVLLEEQMRVPCGGEPPVARPYQYYGPSGPK